MQFFQLMEGLAALSQGNPRITLSYPQAIVESKFVRSLGYLPSAVLECLSVDDQSR